VFLPENNSADDCARAVQTLNTLRAGLRYICTLISA